jgi:hypothetical protein
LPRLASDGSPPTSTFCVAGITGRDTMPGSVTLSCFGGIQGGRKKGSGPSRDFGGWHPFIWAGQPHPVLAPLQVAFGRGPAYLLAQPPQARQKVLLDASLWIWKLHSSGWGESDITGPGHLCSDGLGFLLRGRRSRNEGSVSETTRNLLYCSKTGDNEESAHASY